MRDTPAGSLPQEPLTSAREEYLAGTDQEPTTTSLTSWKLPAEIDWSKISERGNSVKLVIADKMADGWTQTEIGEKLGRTPSWVSDRLTELRQEILLTQTNNHVSPLGRDELDSLRESIKDHGIQTPILVGEHTVIDGKHRCLIASELGIEVPAFFVLGLTEEEEHEVALAVNTARRQLSQKQKHDLVRRELLANWTKSDRALASICGVSAPTIGRIREELRREQETKPTEEQLEEAKERRKARVVEALRQPEVRVDRRGREFVVEPKQTKETILGYHACPECGVALTVLRTGEEYVLRHDRD